MARASKPLTPETILATAEAVMARYGPDRTSVVDIARALHVSHGSVYRHFPTKAALRQEVARRWLDRLDEPLGAVLAAEGLTATERVRTWIRVLSRTKVELADRDPDLFDAYVALVEESDTAVRDHVAVLLSQLSGLLAAGMAAGEVRRGDPDALAADLFRATSRFHDPLNRPRWSAPDLAGQLDRVLDLLLAGMRPGATPR